MRDPSVYLVVMVASLVTLVMTSQQSMKYHVSLARPLARLTALLTNKQVVIKFGCTYCRLYYVLDSLLLDTCRL
jgi:hypothetical protein